MQFSFTSLELCIISGSGCEDCKDYDLHSTRSVTESNCILTRFELVVMNNTSMQ